MPSQLSMQNNMTIDRASTIAPYAGNDIDPVGFGGLSGSRSRRRSSRNRLG